MSTPTAKMGNIETSLNEGGNYPAENDSTPSGGYGSATNVWSNRTQRGAKAKGDEDFHGSTGLVNQSLSGSDLSHEIQDAKQGRDGGWPTREPSN
ncbi:hypothetical protein FA15DRAFT_640653 [Coprinopsis marcescibilis]|uniref:Uncharacterized protein n=1 Tax=Coprinopsis marcescibilis TaxID=230819 RepID=A0A5C3KX52_COPMA|nr:hypothetical protein FA15DRAFT_640653 [Coprinopsis marcescibilis]